MYTLVYFYPAQLIFGGSELDFANAVVYNKASNLQGFISGKGPSMAARNLKQQAYNVIKEKIINCEFAPGAVYNEEYLCEEVNTSRTPVRDALGRLEQEGLIKIMPKRGIVVSPLTPKDVRMVYEMRLLLEPYSLRQYGDALGEPEILRYHRFFSLPDISGRQFFQADDDFHMWIMEAADNIYLKKNYELLYNQNRRFRILTGTLSARRVRETCGEHVRILTACLEKDWENAALAMEDHLHKSREGTFELLLARQREEAGFRR